jgi:hypothetical protein
MYILRWPEEKKSLKGLNLGVTRLKFAASLTSRPSWSSINERLQEWSATRCSSWDDEKARMQVSERKKTDMQVECPHGCYARDAAAGSRQSANSSSMTCCGLLHISQPSPCCLTGCNHDLASIFVLNQHATLDSRLTRPMPHAVRLLANQPNMF